MAKTLKPFVFKGYTFIPQRQLNKAEMADQGPKSALFNNNNQIREARPVLNNREKGWDYEKFYAAAKEAGAAKIDLFLVQGRGKTLYLPTTAYLSILPSEE